MKKGYDQWNKQKKSIDKKRSSFVKINQREIWWCNLGLNIGDEENGKGPNYARPVLIIKKFNNRICVVVPLTSQNGNPKFYKEIKSQKISGFIIISQIKIISTKRLIRLIYLLDYNQFKNIKENVINLLI